MECKKGTRNSASQYTNIIIEKYKSGISSEQIARELNIGATSVRRILKNNQIKTRNLSESCLKYYLNQNYFDEIDTPNKAYILGFWYSDGCNCKKYNYLKLELKKTDQEILEKIRKEMNLGKPVYKSKKPNASGNYTASIRIYSTHMCEMMEKWGCGERKTFSLKFPKWMQKELVPHFLRGCFDGDGFVSDYSIHKGARCSLTGFEDFILGVVTFLSERFKLNYKIYDTDSEKIKDFVLCNKADVKIFLDYIYKDADLYLERKYNKYRKIFYPE